MRSLPPEATAGQSLPPQAGSTPGGDIWSALTAAVAASVTERGEIRHHKENKFGKASNIWKAHMRELTKQAAAVRAAAEAAAQGGQAALRPAAAAAAAKMAAAEQQLTKEDLDASGTSRHSGAIASQLQEVFGMSIEALQAAAQPCYEQCACKRAGTHVEARQAWMPESQTLLMYNYTKCGECEEECVIIIQPGTLHGCGVANA